MHIRPRRRVLDLGSADIGGSCYRTDDADHHCGARDHDGNDHHTSSPTSAGATTTTTSPPDVDDDDATDHHDTSDHDHDRAAPPPRSGQSEVRRADPTG